MPNITLPQTNDKVHLLATEIFDGKDVLKPSATIDFYLNGDNRLARINVDYKTD